MKMFSSGVTQFENKSGSAALSFEGMEHCETVRDSQRQEVEEYGSVGLFNERDSGSPSKGYS